jgi:hypothetical protein
VGATLGVPIVENARRGHNGLKVLTRVKVCPTSHHESPLASLSRDPTRTERHGERQNRNESPAEVGLFGGQQGLRYCFFSGVVLPLPALPDVDGLVKLPPDVPPLPDVDGLVEGEVPPAPPLRASRRQFSRSAPVRAAHFAGTSVEEPLAELPLVPLDALSL